MEKRVPYIGIVTALGVLISFQFKTRGGLGIGGLAVWAVGIGLTFLGEFLGAKMKFRYGANIGAAIPAALFIILAEVLTACLGEIQKTAEGLPNFYASAHIFRYAFEVPAVCALIANAGSIVTDRLLIFREHHGDPDSLTLKPFLPLLITSGACSVANVLISYLLFFFGFWTLGDFEPAYYISSLAQIGCLTALALAIGKWLDKLTGKKIIGYALVAAAGAFRVFVNAAGLRLTKRDPFAARYRFNIIVWAALIIAAGVLIYKNLPGFDEPKPDEDTE